MNSQANTAATTSTDAAVQPASTWNCFFANATECGDGIPVVKDGKKFYIDLGSAGHLTVFKQAVEGNPPTIFSASIWVDGNTPHVFGARRSDETSAYVLVDTGVDGCQKNALQGIHTLLGDPWVVDRGRIGSSLRFVCKMQPGDEMAVLTADGKLHGLVCKGSDEGVDLDIFAVSEDRVEGITSAIKLSEAMHLASLTGDKAQGARQAGYHKLLDRFQGGEDGGKGSFDILFSAKKANDMRPEVTLRFMKLIHPRLLDLARTYGLVTLENEGITVWKHGDDVYRIPKERPKLSPKQIEAKKAARREASRAIRDKMQSPSGKKGS